MKREKNTGPSSDKYKIKPIGIAIMATTISPKNFDVLE